MTASYPRETDPERSPAQGNGRSPLLRWEGENRFIKKGESKECFYFQMARKIIGDKWSLLTMFILKDGSMRFNALLRGVEGISQKVLASTLKDLERDGYIKREVMHTTPPCVAYSLTAMGEDFLRMLTTVSAWVENNWQAMEDNRRAFDRRSESVDPPSRQPNQMWPGNPVQRHA